MTSPIPLEDAYEGITHSICTLEFEAHRPLYDWVIENCECENVPHQYEFARLNLTRTIMSKRYLKRLVDEGVVSGWDDPAHAHDFRPAPPGLYARIHPGFLRADRRGESQQRGGRAPVGTLRPART